MSDVAGPGLLPQLGQIYPQARFWLFGSGAFCVSGSVSWSYVDESRNVVMGDGFAGPFNARAVVFDGRRSEFEIGGGRLCLWLSFEITDQGAIHELSLRYR
jgi:hypothetical protein